MKKYKMVTVSMGINPKKNIDKLEQTINDMASKGWDLVPQSGTGLFFVREKN